MKTGIRPLLIVAFFFASCLVAPAQFTQRDPLDPVILRGEVASLDPASLVETRLLADAASIVPGKDFTIGIQIKLQPGWHAFWQFPGGPGLPLSVEWALPVGFKAGSIQWPIPHAIVDDGVVSYVYEDEVALLVRITPPAQISTASMAVKAKLAWQVCDTTTARQCVPGHSEAELQMDVAGISVPANADLFAKWQARLPRTGGPFKAIWDLSRTDQVALRIEGVPAGTQLAFYPLPPVGAHPGTPVVSPPAKDGSRTITAPLDEASAPGLPWSGLIVTNQAGVREGWAVASPATDPRVPGLLASQPAQSRGFPLMLASAFLGGLILNVMPCVLPVIALKIFGFVKQAGEVPERVFRLGLAFAAGVFVFFLGIAGAVIALRTAGRTFNWGLQFQNPYLFAGLIAAVFVFGLSLLGVFEFTLSSGTATKLSILSGREGYAGAFLHGLFTTALGASCTAPFLGTSLFYATTQSSFTVFVLFAAIAAGMSLPYLLLTARPAWLRFLPKPGLWMERAKQITGFIMLGVTAWLFGIFVVNRPEASAGLIHYLLVLGFACWWMGSVRSRFVALAGAAVLAVAGYFLFLQAPLQALQQTRKAAGGDQSSDGLTWQPFSTERISKSAESGRLFVIDLLVDHPSAETLAAANPEMLYVVSLL